MFQFGDVSLWWGAWGGVLFLLLVGKFTRSESRLLLAGACALLLAPVPESLYVVGAFGVVLKLLDVVHL